MAIFIQCGKFQNDGEKRLVEELRKKLSDDYCIIANYKLTSKGGSPLDIDAIVLAPHALYVIEDKSWSGEITGDDSGWFYGGKRYGNIMETIEHKAKVLKSTLKDYYVGFEKISVQSCVSLSADPTPKLDRLETARKEYILGVNKMAEFISDSGRLERSRLSHMAGRYQAMLRRAIVKGLKPPRGLRINNGPADSYQVERIAYPHNRYTPYLAQKNNETIILKSYDLPKEQRTEDLEQFVRQHHKVVERYHDVLSRLQEGPRDDGARYIEIGNIAFIDKDKGFYVVSTRWQGGDWELLSAKRGMDFNTKLEVAIRLCQGLGYAHAHGIVHRNLSLDSILVSNSGEVRIIDWDFAIFWDEKNKKQVHGTTYAFVDSPEETKSDLRLYEHFQAPELKREQALQDLSNQLSVNNISYEMACPETDLYSLGVVLLELFGKPNYRGDVADAMRILISQRMIEESANHILSLCSEDPQNRNSKSLSELVNLFEEQAGQKYLPRLGQNFIWNVGKMELTGASNRRNTRMSVSYRMEETHPEKRSVLVKFLKTNSVEDAKSEQRDIRTLLEKIDLRYTAALLHDGSVVVAEDGKISKNHDPNDPGLRYYQIFEYVEGIPLDQAILGGEFLDHNLALELSFHLLSAIQSVHEAGWVHYDIKPDNFILLPDWKELLEAESHLQVVKLIDFGSSHRIEVDIPRKSLSPGFKSPDTYQATGDKKYQIDLNSAVLVIISMLCGLNPSPNYGPNLDMNLLEQRVDKSIFVLLKEMIVPHSSEWKFKTVSHFAIELEKSMRNEQHDIQQEYESIKKYIAGLYDDVMNPILARLEEEGFSGIEKTEEYTDYYDKAKYTCTEAGGQIEELVRLKDAAIAKGIDLGDIVKPLKLEWDIVDLRRCLAWAIDKKGEPELTSAVDKARFHLSENKGNEDSLVVKLLEQAIKRREVLAEEENTVGSTKVKSDMLKDVVEQLSNLSDSDVPTGFIRELKNIFRRIIESTSKFERLGIKDVRDETAIDQYKSLPSTDEQKQIIRERVLHAIEEFEKKARPFVITSPKTAQRWFENVTLLREFLDEKLDAVILKDLDILNSDIEEYCTRWEKSTDYLSKAKEYLGNPANGEESYWEACRSARKAFDTYPHHTGIDEVIYDCIERITSHIRLNLKGAQKSREEEFIKLQSELTNDWRKRELRVFDPPKWLLSFNDQIKQEVDKADRLEENYRKNLGSELFIKETEHIISKTKKIIDDNQENKIWIETQIAKRRAIRLAIQSLQQYVKDGDIETAQINYDDLCNHHPDWKNDIELKNIPSLIAANLDVPDLIKQARLAFANKEWVNCIDCCQKIRKKIDGIPDTVYLSEVINKEYLSQHLERNSIEMPEGGYPELVLVMEKLALLYQSAQNIERTWARRDYIESKDWIKQFEMCAEDSSPIVKTVMSEIKFEERYEDYIRRDKFGKENFQSGKSLNHLAEEYSAEFEKQSSNPASADKWITESQNLLEQLLKFDKETQTLWVGKRQIWLDELSSKFLAQLTLWIGNLKSRQTWKESELNLAISCLGMARSIGKFYNIDSQQRRWVVLTYSRMREDLAANNYENLVHIWREAVSVLPDDTEIKNNFKAAQKECWKALLDNSLDKLAQGKKDVDDYLQKLFEQEEPSYLFSPIETAEGNIISFPLNRFDNEIEIRSHCRKKMNQADETVSKDTDSLMMVIRDLENPEIFKQDMQQGLDEQLLENLKKILQTKSRSLAQKYVDLKIREGDGFLLKQEPLKATKSYIQAFALDTKSPKCIDLITSRISEIKEYWQSLKRKIDGLNIKYGTIQSQLKSAKELSLDFDGIKKIQEYLADNETSREIALFKDILKTKQDNLEYGLMLLNDNFSPLSEEWQNVIQTNGDKSSAWRRIKTEVTALEKIFGAEHDQVKKIRSDVFKFSLEIQENLYRNYGIIKNVLLQQENPTLDALLKICSQVNDVSVMLPELESDHHDLWSNWEGKAPYTVYYPNKYAAYSKWKFRIIGGIPNEHYREEIPVCLYWRNSERFKEWMEWLREFVKVETVISNSGQERLSEYKFDKSLWEVFWENHSDIEAWLRSDYDSDDVFLGSFLMLAFKTSEFWRKENEDAKRKLADYEQLYKNIHDFIEVGGWFTREYLQVTNSHLQIWSVGLSNLLKMPLHLMRSSKNDMRLVEDILRKSTALYQKIQKDIEELDNEEKKLTDNFNELFNYAIPRRMKSSDEQKEVLRKLKNFTGQIEVLPSIEMYAKSLNISFNNIKERYISESKPKNIFYAYAHGLTT